VAKFRFELEDERRAQAPAILKELASSFGYNSQTTNKILNDYIKTGDLQLPDMLSQDTQGPLNQGQQRESPTNSLRPPIYTTEKGSGVFSPAPAGVADANQIKELSTDPTQGVTTLYTRGANGYQVVGTQPSKTDRWVDVTPSNERGTGRPDPYAGKDPVRVKDALSTLAEHRKRLAPHYGPGGQVTPPQIDPELENRAIDAAQYIGVPVHTETTPGNPGHSFMGIRWGDTPESKRIVIGDTPIDPNTFGNGQRPAMASQNQQVPVQPRKQESARSFNSVEDAEAAHLPKGTIIMIGGRRARVK
jgi:hypothetical protein